MKIRGIYLYTSRGAFNLYEWDVHLNNLKWLQGRYMFTVTKLCYIIQDYIINIVLESLTPPTEWKLHPNLYNYQRLLFSFFRR